MDVCNSLIKKYIVIYINIMKNIKINVNIIQCDVY